MDCGDIQKTGSKEPLSIVECLLCQKQEESNKIYSMKHSPGRQVMECKLNEHPFHILVYLLGEIYHFVGIFSVKGRPVIKYSISEVPYLVCKPDILFGKSNHFHVRNLSLVRSLSA